MTLVTRIHVERDADGAVSRSPFDEVVFETTREGPLGPAGANLRLPALVTLPAAGGLTAPAPSDGGAFRSVAARPIERLDAALDDLAARCPRACELLVAEAARNHVLGAEPDDDDDEARVKRA